MANISGYYVRFNDIAALLLHGEARMGISGTLLQALAEIVIGKDAAWVPQPSAPSHTETGVLGLEQYKLGHSLGNPHGQTRIIRLPLCSMANFLVE